MIMARIMVALLGAAWPISAVWRFDLLFFSTGAYDVETSRAVALIVSWLLKTLGTLHNYSCEARVHEHQDLLVRPFFERLDDYCGVEVIDFLSIVNAVCTEPYTTCPDIPMTVHRHDHWVAAVLRLEAVQTALDEVPVGSKVGVLKPLHLDEPPRMLAPSFEVSKTEGE